MKKLIPTSYLIKIIKKTKKSQTFFNTILHKQMVKRKRKQPRRSARGKAKQKHIASAKKSCGPRYPVKVKAHCRKKRQG